MYLNSLLLREIILLLVQTESNLYIGSGWEEMLALVYIKPLLDAVFNFNNNNNTRGKHFNTTKNCCLINIVGYKFQIQPKPQQCASHFKQQIIFSAIN